MGDAYLAKNKEYWEHGYTAINVDHPVFRFYGRILKPDFPHLKDQSLLEFGCGQGSAVNYFWQNGFDVHGVDISEKDIASGRIRYPYLSDRLHIVDPKPEKNAFYAIKSDIAIVSAIQSLYYFNDHDFDACMSKIYGSMRKGGVFFCTMMGTKSKEFYENSKDVGEGLRRVEFKNDRLDVKDYFMFFIENEEHLIKKFKMFRPLHIGYYCGKFRSDEGDGFHYTFCGVKE